MIKFKKVLLSNRRTKLKLSLGPTDGFTIVETIVALGLASIVAVGLSSAINFSMKGQKGIAQSIAWNQLQNEMQLLFSTPEPCKNIFLTNPTPYFVGGGTTTDTAMDGQPLQIARWPVSATSYPIKAGRAEPGDASGNPIDANYIMIDSIIMGGGATVTDQVKATGNSFRIPIFVTAHKGAGPMSVPSGAPSGIPNDNQALGSSKLFATYVVNVTKAADNSIVSCTTSLGDLSNEQNCTSIGGVWRSSPPAGEPQCLAITAAPNPITVAPVPTYTTSPVNAYNNICPPGTTLSGIDLSTGKARAACTISSPTTASGCTNANQVLTWVVTDATLPYTGGSYKCVDVDTCGTGQYLQWNSTKFQCAPDRLATADVCTAGQYSWWNGTKFQCTNVPPTPTAACNLNNQFLQWTGSAYTCGQVKPNPLYACDPSSSVLVWDGNDFRCAANADANAPNCPSGTSLYYDPSTKAFGCRAQPPPLAHPATSCAANEYLDMNATGSALVCKPLPAATSRPKYSAEIDYRSCVRAPYDAATSGGAISSIARCPAGYVGVGASGSGTGGDSDGHFHGLNCCKVVGGSVSSGGYIVNTKSNWAPAICLMGAAVTAICSSGGSGDCYGMGVNTNKDNAVVVECSWVDYPTFELNYFATNGYAPYTYGGCYTLSSSGWGEFLQCHHGDILVGYCDSSGTTQCNGAQILYSLGWGFGNKAAIPTTATKFGTQAYCCPVQPNY